MRRMTVLFAVTANVPDRVTNIDFNKGVVDAIAELLPRIDSTDAIKFEGVNTIALIGSDEEWREPLVEFKSAEIGV